MVLSSDGYFLHYDKKRNYIMISLPQTAETVTNTVEQLVDRKVDVGVSELTMILNLVKLIFERDGKADI